MSLKFFVQPQTTRTKRMKKHIFANQHAYPICGNKKYNSGDLKKYNLDELLKIIDDSLCKRCIKIFNEIVEKKLSLKEKIERKLIARDVLTSLCKWGYIDENDQLTSKGIALTLSNKDLEEQCKKLGFELVEIERKWRCWSDGGIQNQLPLFPKGPVGSFVTASPEQEAFSYFRKQGYKGYYGSYGPFSEGEAIFLLLKSMCLKTLVKLNEISYLDIYITPFTSLIQIQKDKSNLILNEIKVIEEKQIIENFREICASGRSYPGLDEGIIQGIYQSLGKKNIISIFNVLKKDPYAYRKGWPDLTLYRNNEILFVEVKTTDNLLESQMVTMSDMQKVTDVKFCVLRLKARIGEANPPDIRNRGEEAGQNEAG